MYLYKLMFYIKLTSKQACFKTEQIKKIKKKSKSKISKMMHSMLMCMSTVIFMLTGIWNRNYTTVVTKNK
jgi:hypothetical protein